MTDTNHITDLISVFEEFCRDKGFEYSISNKSNYFRFDISHQKEHAIVNLYNTGSISVQGPKTELYQELEEWKQNIEKVAISYSSISNKACSQSYQFSSEEIRKRLKEALSLISESSTIIDQPSTKEEYRITILKGRQKATLTQYITGRLIIQGKYDNLFSECCDCIEKIGNPDQKEVICRFISLDEEKVEEIACLFSPAIEEKGAIQAKLKLGEVFDYLNDYDRKYFIASECLEISRLNLPEYSAYVMPAAKGFEGFIKKILEDIGFKQKGYFQHKGADFKPLGNENDPIYQQFLKNNPDKHLPNILRRVHTSLNHYRNFMMHSDGGNITAVDTIQDAEAKISRIMHETKEFFDYFNGVFRFHP